MGLKGKRVVLVGSTWCQGNVQQHHNPVHSLAPAHHLGRAALLLVLRFLTCRSRPVTLLVKERDCSFNLALLSAQVQQTGLELIAFTVYHMLLLLLFTCMNSCYLRNANI